VFTQRWFVKIAKMKGWTAYQTGGGKLTSQGVKFVVAFEESPQVRTLVAQSRVSKLLHDCKP
jgi:hypothetical protein